MQMIVFDRTLPANSQIAPFWVRVQEDATTVRIVEVNAVSLPQAYRNALALGLDPTGWTDGGVVMPIPSGLDHMRRTAMAA